jgi:hypothetical protein
MSGDWGRHYKTCQDLNIPLKCSSRQLLLNQPIRWENLHFPSNTNQMKFMGSTFLFDSHSLLNFTIWVILLFIGWFLKGKLYRPMYACGILSWEFKSLESHWKNISLNHYRIAWKSVNDILVYIVLPGVTNLWAILYVQQHLSLRVWICLKTNDNVIQCRIPGYWNQTLLTLQTEGVTSSLYVAEQTEQSGTSGKQDMVQKKY